MKKWIAALLSILLIMSVFTSTAVVAQETPDAEQVIEIDALDADTVPDADSYTIVDDGETLLEVTHIKELGVTAALVDSASEYYTADFVLPDSGYQVYLTGLTQDNVDEIRQAIIAGYTEGADFDLKNLGFIDAEKTWENDGDENLCWAASAANLLTYTGWAAQAGFGSTDDLFEAIIGSFSDEGGNVDNATSWFLNGSTMSGGAQPTAGTGAYLPQYSYSDLVETIDLYNNCVENLWTVYERLHNGYGASLSVDIYNSEGFESSHAITLWGFVTDPNYPKTSEEFYKNILITDSDSDKYSVQDGKDRRDADDVMSLYALEAFHQDAINTYQFRISDRKLALITEAKTMAPFSDAIPHETSEDATLDPVNYPDIVLDPFILTNDENDDDNTLTTFLPNTEIYYQPCMMNVGSAGYNGRLSLSVKVKDLRDNVVYEKDFRYHQDVAISPSRGMMFQKESVKLPVGDYVITASFNMDHNTQEAYYYNNTRSVRFKVRDQYRIGDADKDGIVNISDLTKVQRVLVNLDQGDALFEQRSDIDGDGAVNVRDVTLGLRYLAHIDVPYPIDELRFYE
ncbi:MAG TPA: hypothetical protein DCY72_03730 [Ruminococcaceae bacterium]|nr:hypothetical protein [Oscillospiraceae bacterium]